MERLTVDHNLEKAAQEKQTLLNTMRIADGQRIKLVEQENLSELHRTDLEGRRESAELEHEVEVRRMQLEMERKRDLELELLNLGVRAKELEEKVDAMRREAELARREISQVYSEGHLRAKFIEALPRVAAEFKVDRYTVFDSSGGGEGRGISPLGRMVQEVVSILGDSEFAGLFQDKATDRKVPKPG